MNDHTSDDEQTRFTLENRRNLLNKFVRRSIEKLVQRLFDLF